MNCSTPGLPVHQQLLEFTQTHVHPAISSSHPLLLLPSIFPSIKVFSSESAVSIRWPKYWSFSFCISPSKEYSGLISFRIDWFHLAVQRTLKSLLQHHSLKALIHTHQGNQNWKRQVYPNVHHSTVYNRFNLDIHTSLYLCASPYLACRRYSTKYWLNFLIQTQNHNDHFPAKV